MKEEEIRKALIDIFCHFDSIRECPNHDEIKRSMDLLVEKINKTGLIAIVCDYRFPRIKVAFLGYCLEIFFSVSNFDGEREVCVFNPHAIKFKDKFFYGVEDCSKVFLKGFKACFPGCVER